MPAKDAHAYLRHIHDCCRKLIVCGTLRQRGEIPEALLLDAICRNIEIIGEAAGKLGPDFRDAHPEIPWRQMIAARNILIHNYDGIDPAIVWGILERDIPPLLANVDRLLAPDQP